MLAPNNSFTGNIPHNNFSGSIPRCLITSAVEGLNLRNNNLIGRLPNIFDKTGSLAILDVSHNQITGKLPRSLRNCTNLEIVNVEGNTITDTFPFWLTDLPNLEVMVLRSNMFHGPIYSLQHPLSFPQLRIIDISHNRFTGSLPQNYFVNWSTLLISIPPEEGDMYVGYGFTYSYYPSMFLRNKGITMELEKILKTYTAIDFSENKLEGQIPESVGLLKSLIVLNLSNNDFTGHISSSWANLTRLESLGFMSVLSGKCSHSLDVRITFIYDMKKRNHSNMVSVIVTPVTSNLGNSGPPTISRIIKAHIPNYTHPKSK
ncbi:hypothetical protein YC2023_104587 [Brassica napus]